MANPTHNSKFPEPSPLPCASGKAASFPGPTPPQWKHPEASIPAPFLLPDELGFLFPELTTVPEEPGFFGGGDDVFPFDGAAVSAEDLEFTEEAAQLGFNRDGDGTAAAGDPVNFLVDCNSQDAGFGPAGDATDLVVEAPELARVSSRGEGECRPEIATVPVDLIQNRRPFRCSHAGCGRAFKNPQTLKMHHRTHDKEELLVGGGGAAAAAAGGGRAGQNKKIPCRCPVCLRAFVGLYELRRHYGRKHTGGEKAHGCGKCGKRFYVEADMKDHERLCGALVGCKCGLKFAFKCNLSAHKRTHPECSEEHPPAAAAAAAAINPRNNVHGWKSAVVSRRSGSATAAVPPAACK